MKLLVATNNQGKQEEFEKILAESGMEILFPRDVNLEDLDVDETGKSFRENALLKAKEFGEKTGLLSVADDSGLEVEFLGGAPGVSSKRFFPGTDQDRNDHLLSLMLEAKNPDQRKAHFKTVLCLYDPITYKDYYFEGIYKGSIAFESAGESGFGYDPIFVPQGEEKTSAQLGLEYKNDNSHRSLAIKKLAQFLKDYVSQS